MRLFITGIEGFVGRHLSAVIAEHNRHTEKQIEVSGLYYPTADINHLSQYGFDLSPIDITDREAVEQTLTAKEPDVIIHLAGIAFVPQAMKDPMQTWSVNLNGGLNILEWLRQKSPKTLAIIISTGEVYGAPSAPEDIPYTEKSLLNPVNVYAATKAALDIAARQYAKAWQLDIVVARPYNHIGPWQSENFVVSTFAKQVASAKLGIIEPIIKVGNLSAARDFTDVRDVVRAYLMMISDVEAGTYNICSSKPVQIQHILDKLIEIADVDVEVQVDPSRLRPVDVPVLSASYEKLHSQCGWKPQIPLDRTLDDIINWYLEILS